MGRAPCCSKQGVHRGPWSVQEDALLINYIRLHGEGYWRNLPKRAGLLRCGKSCRLRWMNYLRPDIKRGNISSDEEDLIIRLHSLLGNRWSLIAKRLPGRTDNEIKNYWNSHLSKGVETSNRASTDQPKPSRELKKRIQSQCKNGKKLEKDETADEEPTKTKIYLPKAIRISPNCIAVSNVASGSLSGDGTNHREVPLKTEAPCWPHKETETGAADQDEDYYNSFFNFVDIENNTVDGNL